ncbi:MAG: purine-nucleoside phosphorylase [Elusimicrobiota bacterium]|nr:purine-nucleoside phosphorylase [Endomicrobiia bacterium]MDW8165229.1 purine-nucleoside phosphorylase [Elusimicrobiota bacterium]
MKNEFLEKLNAAFKFIIKEIKQTFIDYAIILGSGLGNIPEVLEEKIVIPYHEVPHMVKSTVKGHKGNFIFGVFEKKPLVIMEGRLHYYEGYSMQEITFPIRILQKLKIKYLIITAAVGGIRNKLPLDLSDIVLIKDHINLIGDNPLRGPHYEELGERFVDLTNTYDKDLIKLAKNIAKKNKIKVYEGIYLATCGPSYETPAEIEAFKKLGADVVGMSVVPEAIVARQAGMKVLGICYITNLAAGISTKPLSHLEVLETATKVAYKLNLLIKEILKKL